MSRRRHMSQTERDLQGIEAAKARARSRSELRELELADESDGTVRQDDPDPEHVTSPIELLERELTETGQQIAADLGVDLNAPVSFGQFVKLLERVNEVKREERRNHRESSNRLMTAMGKRPPAEELRSLRVKVNILWALLIFALMSAGTSLVTVTRWLKDSGKEEVIRQQLIEHDSDHERRLRRLEWRGLDSGARSGVGSGQGP